MSARTILLVEDNAEYRSILAMLLRCLGFEVEVAVDGADALEKYPHSLPALVATDWEMPRLGGEQLVQELRRLDPDLPIVVISGLTFETPIGATACIPKAYSTPASVAAELLAIWKRTFPESA